ncbi:7661_t:CDS:1, partial [Acaulospora morrowiae]
ELQGYLNPVEVVGLNGDQNFVSNPSFTNDAILSNNPTTYIGDPPLNAVNTTAYTGDSSEIAYGYMSTEDEVMIN